MQHAIRWMATASLVVGLAACNAPRTDHADPGATAMALKIYAVPPAQTNQLSQSLGDTLGKTANVTVPALGKLLVYAPIGAHASIGAALTSLAKSGPAAAAQAQVDLHFWVVDAQPRAGTDEELT